MTPASRAATQTFSVPPTFTRTESAMPPAGPGRSAAVWTTSSAPSSAPRTAPRSATSARRNWAPVAVTRAAAPGSTSIPTTSWPSATSRRHIAVPMKPAAPVTATVLIGADPRIAATVARYRSVDPSQSFPELEEQILERWRERDVFHESVRRREGCPEFVFYEGPPTANGPPGSHHVLSRVFKDVFPRFKTMRGHQVHRKGGWDCHGLPVELQIERKLGFHHKDDIERYGVAEFNQQCRESVLEYIDEWARLTERIAFWVDTDDAYFTLEDDYIESVWWSLKQVWKKGLLYEGHKVVPYCTALRDGALLSTRSRSATRRSRTRRSTSASRSRGEEGVSFLAWTTMPWTLLPHAALVVDPGRRLRARPAWTARS